MAAGDETEDPDQAAIKDARAAKRPRVDDPDRAAILARRQHFIALALTGLASTACTDGQRGNQGSSGGDAKSQAAPQPCLKESVRDDEGEEQPPQPCLSIAPPEPPPRPCLKIAAPDPEGETEGESETGAGETGVAEPAPKPCLKKAAPRPCLRKASSPKPCLKTSDPDMF